MNGYYLIYSTVHVILLLVWFCSFLYRIIYKIYIYMRIYKFNLWFPLFCLILYWIFIFRSIFLWLCIYCYSIYIIGIETCVCCLKKKRNEKKTKVFTFHLCQILFLILSLSEFTFHFSICVFSCVVNGAWFERYNLLLLGSAQ